MNRRGIHGIGLVPPVMMGGNFDEAYLLRDDFTDTLPAGSVNGTLAVPGPGNRVVVDTGFNVSTLLGRIKCVAYVQNGNPFLTYTPTITRAAGRLAVFSAFDEWGAGRFSAGFWDLANPLVPTNALGAWVDFAGLIGCASNGANDFSGNLVSIIGSADTPLAVGLRASGAFYWHKTGGNWHLDFISSVGSTATLYVGWGMRLSSLASLNYIRVPVTLWLPAPLASDSFNRADGAIGMTDGAGHAEANGGTNLPWTGGAIAGNALAISPSTVGGDLIVNGTFTGWTADNPDGWSYSTEDANTKVTQNPAGKCEIISNIGTYFFIAQAGLLDPTKWYTGTIDVDTVAAGSLTSTYLPSMVAILSTTGSGKPYSGRAVGSAFDIKRVGITDVTIDNVSVYKLSTSSLFSSLIVSTVNILIDCEVSVRNAGTQCGLVARLDSDATPANFIIAYFYGDGTVKVDECVAGVYTQLLSAVQAFTASDHLVLDLNGTAWRLYHRTAAGVTTLLGNGATNVVTGNLAGGFSTYAANRINSFVVWAKGVENQYSILDKWSKP